MEVTKSQSMEFAPRESLQTIESGSTRIYRIDWNKYFPHKIESTPLTITRGNYDLAVEFMKLHFKEIHQVSDDEKFLPEDYSESKRRYYKEFGDFFFFRDNDHLVGFFVGTLLDWSSYYIRNCSILPSFQNKKIYQNMISRLLDGLGENNVDRVEVDVSPSNLAAIHIFNKLKFNVTGTTLSERWGSNVKFTKFLNHKNETVFLDQFCYGVRPQRNVDANNLTKG